MRPLRFSPVHLLLGSFVLAGIVALSPRAAQACSWNPCYFDSPRVEQIELLTASPVPRDGAFTFTTQQYESPTCLDELAPHLSVRVTRGGAVIPGDIVQLAGLPAHFIWRPTTLLTAGAIYKLHIRVDNDALAPDDAYFGETCGPSSMVANFQLSVGDTLTERPVPAPPTLVPSPRVWDTSLRGVICCPGVVPEYFDGGCYPEVLWDFEDPSGCGFPYGFTGVEIEAEPPELPLPHARQFVDQLIVDGEPVHRVLSDGPIAAFRATAGCTRLERIHLGTGEVIASDETCPDQELLAQLGPRNLGPPLRCDDAEVCASDETSWDGTCHPFDPEGLIRFMPEQTQLDPTCPDTSVPADASPLARGCDCRHDATASGSLPLLLLLLLRRRPLTPRARPPAPPPAPTS